MKVPRWIVRLLIASSTFTVVAALTIWVVLPGRTARRFRDAIKNRQFEIANRLMTNAEWSRSERSIQIEAQEPASAGRGWHVPEPEKVDLEIVVESLTIKDLLLGIRRLQLVRVDTYPEASVVFVARSGSVDCERLNE